MIRSILLCLLLSLLLVSCNDDNNVGRTEITKWKYEKTGAVSITYDDGNINQFKNAMPVMDRLGFPGTFYIVTGEIPGSKYAATFIGRPVEQIIQETKTVVTNKENFFERASAVGYLGYKGTLDYHFRAGQLFESGKIDEAYKQIDEAYAKVRSGSLIKGQDISWEAEQSSANTWNEFKPYAAKGHEFGSHSISHARLAVLDEPNLLYELEKSKEDILHHLGPEHIFSAECPFGTEDERVMQYAHKLFPALRNRMPQPYLQELNRGNKTTPGSSNKEYVQWQRGALSDIPMQTMKSWVDTVLEHDNIWMVLVFHGVDGIGWQPRTTEDIQTYFEYIKEKENKLWVATFKDVTQYVTARMNAKVDHSKDDDRILINLTHSLDQNLYNQELTLKTYIPDEWNKVQIIYKGKSESIKSDTDDRGRFVLYQASPNSGPVELSKGS